MCNFGLRQLPLYTNSPAPSTDRLGLLWKFVDPFLAVTSRTFYADDRLKVVGFGFAAGEELSEHPAQTPAVMHFVSGKASFTLANDQQDAVAGTWVHMPAKLRHSVQANTPVAMLLLLLV